MCDLRCLGGVVWREVGLGDVTEVVCYVAKVYGEGTERWGDGVGGAWW